MVRKENRWEKIPAPCPTPSPVPGSGTKTRTTDCRQISPASVTETLNRLGACELRSSFARAVFASRRADFRSEGEWAAAVGKWVTNDIHTNVRLRQQMYALGYRPNQRGYTLEQRKVLTQYYMENGAL